MTPGPRTPPPISDTDPYRVTLTTTTGGGLADPAQPQTALSAGELARKILRRGGGRDVQVLVPDGAQHAALLQALADRLGRDVLMVPAGATTTGADTATPVDRTTGAVVDWLLVQPPSLATSLPGWYDLDGGRIRHRRGWAALPLARGLAFTTREAFPLARAAAAGLGVGHPAMATVAFGVDDAAPLLCGYDGVRVAASGTDLAAALSAVALYGGDLRVWPQVAAPSPAQVDADADRSDNGDPDDADPDTGRLLGIRVDPADRLRHVGLGAEVTDGLAVHLTELAARVGATVWAPPTGSRVVLLEGVRDLAVRDRDGHLRSWQAYRPPGPDRPDRFWSDRDGRLVPVGGTMDAAVGPTGEDQPGPTASGVELVSVATDARPAALRRWATVRRRDGLFRMELAVLDDGRLAARHGDGGLLAVGPREFRALLRRAGWTGQDLALLTPVPPERFAQLRAHVTALADQIPAEIWAPEPGARLAVVEGQPRSLRAAGAPARWCRLAPAAPGATDLVTVSARWRSHDGWLVPTPPAPAAAGASGGRVTAGASADPALDDPAPDAQTPADPPPVDPPPPGRRPPMVPAARGSRGHGVTWLPERPDVNAETFDLYVPVALPAAQVAADGLPTAELFVVGQLDADRLRMAHYGAAVLRVSVAPGGAVATTGLTDTAPPDLRHLLRGVDSYLLPAGWLDRVQLTQGWTPAGPGEWQAQPDVAPAALRLRCTGARHGVDGLPNDVVRWPTGRRAATGYAVLPATGGPDGDHLAVSDSRPAAPVDAARLVQLRIEPGQAIDVAASAGRIAPLTAVRSRLVTLNAAGVEVLVPPRSYDRVTVTRVYGAEDGRWVLRARRVELPLATLFAQAG